MKTITKTITAYTFDELSPAARDHVRYTYFSENPWQYENQKTFEAFNEYFPGIHFNIDRYNNVHLSEKFYNDDTLSLSGARLHRWITNNIADCKGQFDHYLIRDYGHCPLTGYCMDYSILKPLALFYLDPAAFTKSYYLNWHSATLHDVLKKCISTFLNVCDADYEHQQSDEAISENCAINEYLFTDEGDLI